MNIKIPNLPFWEFKKTLVKLEGCLKDKEYYQIKYGHYKNCQGGRDDNKTKNSESCR